MAINSRLKILMLTALFLCGLFSVQAQSEDYFQAPGSEEPRFIQRLAWSGGMYSRHCEVIIEKEESGEYVKYMSKFTADNFIDILLPLGNYRFRVIPYDILDKPAAGTQWAQFKVPNAVKPDVSQTEEKTDNIKEKGNIEETDYPQEMLTQFLYIFSVSWMPLYPAYGNGFGNGWALSNISARLSLSSSMFLNNYIGVEFSLIKYPDDVPNMPNGFSAGAGFLFINWLPDQKGAVNFRIGVDFNIQALDLNSNIGISFLSKIIQNLSIEAGINYVNSSKEGTGGGILPWIGLSIIF
jgi:hypothetical protein